MIRPGIYDIRRGTLGLTCRESNGNESEIAKELEAGHPVICSMRPGDFTDIGHFIILTSYNNGNVTICDPFSLENSKKSWNYSQISSQIKAVWYIQNNS